MSLPSREQCEAWSPAQLARYLQQNNMKECANNVQQNQIDGSYFLRLSDGEIKKFSLVHHLFQTEQTANILRTGRNTINRLRKKAPPKLPVKLHLTTGSLTQTFIMESDPYEDPQADQDDSYEPPPRSERHSPNSFTVSPALPNPRGQYVDSCRGRPTKSNQHYPHRNQRQNTAHVSQISQPEAKEEDYVDPEDEVEDDNYIDPTHKILTKPLVDRGVKPRDPARSNSLGFSEVPDLTEMSKSGKRRSSSSLQPNSQKMPPKASPRLNSKKPAIPEPESDDEYEVCCDDDSKQAKNTETRRLSIPTPRPREIFDRKKPSLDLMPKPSIPQRESKESFCLNSFILSAEGLLQPDPFEILMRKLVCIKRSGMQVVVIARQQRTPSYNLLRQEGSFLLRKSSGVDAQQPYTLVVFYNSRVYNIPVRYIASTKQYALGKEKQGEERFSSVSDIIENHQKTPLVLVDSHSNNKESTKLRHAVKP
ncbi:hypothetical protein DNTS_009878 [Danionella cerebrum]|uniref:SH2 domain-containing protein n=1 Tax=Danionella cerebrum TaxID=2873325 RepID=A0A553NJR2_9TELE|nr:hypothetical protein DNTS_009878 [Danionella translucida]